MTLMEKIRRVGVPLKEFAGSRPLSGIKTGFNDAFLIDTATKERLGRGRPEVGGPVQAVPSRTGHRPLAGGMDRALDAGDEVQRQSPVAVGEVPATRRKPSSPRPTRRFTRT